MAGVAVVQSRPGRRLLSTSISCWAAADARLSEGADILSTEPRIGYPEGLDALGQVLSADLHHARMAARLAEILDNVAVTALNRLD
jgi:hypothetical protein